MPAAVAFDVLGTCFSFDCAVQAVERSLPVQLSKGLNARSLVHDWFHSSQRDYTYLSICSSYVPIFSVLSSTLPRALSIHLDRSASSSHFTSSSPEVKAVLSALTELSPQPGLEEAFKLLHSRGVKIYLVTNGGLSGTRHYVQKAGLEGVVNKVMSCDDVPRGDGGGGTGVAKPDKRVYEFALQSMKEDTGADDLWFCAAHAWDLVGARKAGFRTAYAMHEERVHPLEPDIFGGMKAEVVGSGLVETVEGILKALRG